MGLLLFVPEAVFLAVAQLLWRLSMWYIDIMMLLFCHCSIWWQFIPYFLVGVSEVFTNIGTMELFYTQGELAATNLFAAIADQSRPSNPARGRCNPPSSRNNIHFEIIFTSSHYIMCVSATDEFCPASLFPSLFLVCSV